MIRLYRCDKTVLRLSHGADEFVQAYTTNTPEALNNAFVDLRGRIVAVCSQYRRGPDEMLLIIEKSAEAPLFEHLKKYLDLTGASLVVLPWLVYFDLDGNERPMPQDVVVPQSAGRLLLTQTPRQAAVSEQEFDRFRLLHRIPLQGKDYGDELLLNVFGEDHVSYTKGCYLGQEIIARVHHRGKPPKKLVVRSEKECTQDESRRLTSVAANPDTGEKMGFLFVEK